ncbi:cystinosin homolog isoform X2 [Chelonus insularis]|uniref:cystinosin homolog isoform X2 n=1 Tax=Chelonus insularis TaxID=460826 RepID=UPI00158C1875|nr:cystinosin homolog isoform X2 [Chelonus insularis]XP_034946139.1 cystinosin homolog isoform X2 [Chelonus insularis]XP_034946140.1 cystinosin homolog isoform X2 [Chelonus insularis]
MIYFITMKKFLFIPLFMLLVQFANANLRVSVQDLRILIHENKSFDVILENRLPTTVNVTFDAQHAGLVKINPPTFNITANDSRLKWSITVLAVSPGYSTVSANVTPKNVTDFSEAFVRVTVERSPVLYLLSEVVGWIYFLAWSISFYPQIYINWKRKSVVGLNFDFLSLNIVGFLMYSLFNCGLYWIPEVELEYYKRYPKGLNPVQVNDIFFAIHALCATAFTIGQCFVYETGTQRVSTTARFIHSFFLIFIIVSIFLGIFHVIAWLDFLYFCSYIKLAITLIKYIPQAYYNYKRQSTVGWSIGNIFLDFTGGILSMLQMILNAYNYDDWESIFGDPTKFGLGFFSVAFDVFFIFQHYVLYRDSLKYTELPGTCHEECQPADLSEATSSTSKIFT